MDNFDNGMWSQHAKATLQMEIEQGYHDLKEFSLVEGFLNSEEHNIKTKEEGIALKRLSDMYEDPNFGPDFFLKTTKTIRNCLRLYSLSKNNPTQFGRFFHCSTPSSGIVLHFNSVTAKKELFVLLPSGDQPRQKPAKLRIAHIIKWHQNRKDKAAAIRDKILKAKYALMFELIQTREKQIDAMRTFFSLPQIDSSLERITRCITRLETKNIVSKNFDNKKLVDGILKYSKGRKKTNKQLDDFEALNPQMYGEKEFIQMRIDHSKALTKCFLDNIKQLNNILSLI